MISGWRSKANPTFNRRHEGTQRLPFLDPLALLHGVEVTAMDIEADDPNLLKGIFRFIAG
jgi:hypothetical protein